MRPEPIRLHPPVPMPIEDFDSLLAVAERVCQTEVREARAQGYSRGHIDGLHEGHARGRARARRDVDLATAGGFVLGVLGTLIVLAVALAIFTVGGG